MRRTHPFAALASFLAIFAPSGTYGHAPARYMTIVGSISEGGAPSPFSETIDLTTGSYKRTEHMGEAESQSGFDGQPWGSANGIVAISNLAAAVARGATSAWIDRQAWRERMPADGRRTRKFLPAHGNPVTLEFDPATRLPQMATIDGDWGPITVSFGDWRRVGRFVYPFRREEVSPVGEHTILAIRSAKLAGSLTKGWLNRPPRRPHAVPLPDAVASVPFAAVGAKKTHILVDSTVNAKPAKLIFDTGAANYLTTDAAPRYGLHVSGGLNLSGVGEGSSTGGYATVDRIALGDAALLNETIVVGPSPFPPSSGKTPDVAGFTGYEFFAEYVTTIDYRSQQLRFATELPNDVQALRLPFYNDGSHIYVRAKVNGVGGLFGLDTGDGGTVTIFPAFAARLGLDKEVGNLISSGSGVGGEVKARAGVLRRFTFAGLNFDQLPVEFSHQAKGPFASKSLAGNLGGGILQCFSVTIDFPHHLLLLEPQLGSPPCSPGGAVSRALPRKPAA